MQKQILYQAAAQENTINNDTRKVSLWLLLKYLNANILDMNAFVSPFFWSNTRNHNVVNQQCSLIYKYDNCDYNFFIT